MKQFTETLKKILAVAAGHIQLLPATGGAVEELTNADDTESDDTKFNKEHLTVDSFGALQSHRPKTFQ